MKFEDARDALHAYLSENQPSFRRNHPRKMWKHLLRSMNNDQMPVDPDVIYAEYWRGWKHWLGPYFYRVSTLHNIEPIHEFTAINPRFAPEQVGRNAQWNAFYLRLCKHYEAKGTFIVGNHDDKELQNWVATQRSLNKRGLIDRERKSCLDAIMFDWDAQQGEWSDYFALVLSFKELTGHVEIPSRFILNRRLGDWVRRQRVYYKQGTLPRWKVDKLNSIGFVWEVSEERKYLPLDRRNIE